MTDTTNDQVYWAEHGKENYQQSRNRKALPAFIRISWRNAITQPQWGIPNLRLMLGGKHSLI